MADKTKKVKDGIDKAEEIIDMVDAVAPPNPFTGEAKNAVEAAKIGLGLFERIKAMFKKKKK